MYKKRLDFIYIIQGCDNMKKRRYTQPKKIKKGMSFEKKVGLQTAVSVILLVYAMFVSYNNSSVKQKEYIYKVVNITDNKSDVKNRIVMTGDIAGRCVGALGKYMAKVSDFFDNGFGNTVPDENTVMAEAAIYPQVPEDVREKIKNKSAQENAATVADEEQTITQPVVYIPPVIGRVSSDYGQRVHPISGSKSFHYGLDIAGDYGSCVISSAPGEVSGAGFDPNLGNYVKVIHRDGVETVYGHMSEIMVKKGEIVDDNTRIGSVGSSGAATGPHLHLEFRINGSCVNPRDYLTIE